MNTTDLEVPPSLNEGVSEGGVGKGGVVLGFHGRLYDPSSRPQTMKVTVV